MGRELRRVQKDGDVALVCSLGDLFDRWHPSRDVRGAGDGQELGLRFRVERGDDVFETERAVPSALDKPAATPTRPREQIGVMFDHRRDDDIVGREPQWYDS